MLDHAEALRRWIPRWWRRETNQAGRALYHALAPAESVFAAITTLRDAGYSRGWLRSARAPIPVVSIGNLGVGGAGKTPFSAWIAGRLTALGARPAIVMRGYGADEVEVHRELNPEVPVFASPRRIRGVEEAARQGFDVAVLDDAFQHRAIARDLDIVLVSAESWTAERHLLPRGPWRERGRALARADLVVITRKSATTRAAADVAADCHALAPGVPVAICHLTPTRLLPFAGGELPLGWLDGRDVLVVTSLAEPEPFLLQIRGAGADAELLPFPDHHRFSARDLRQIVARAAGRPIVCTRKEAVKLRSLALEPAARDRVEMVTVDQGVVVQAGAVSIHACLERVLG
jgi:tetraacyldisaccharide 4'-kinase